MKNKEYTQLVIGLGEVGSALRKILNCDGYDKYLYEEDEKTPTYSYDIIHICFPCTNQKKFIEEVNFYKTIHSARIVVVHSSVPIGTCEKLGATHSPIRGVHPYLEEGIRTFEKYVGGPKANEVAQMFNSFGIKTKIIFDSRTTEALKLWDTTQYGIMILLEKEIYEFCRKNGLDFQVIYGSANQSYNEGYEKLGMGYVRRPILEHYPGKIGGHCVIENANLLDSESAKRILNHAKQFLDSKKIFGVDVFVEKTKTTKKSKRNKK